MTTSRPQITKLGNYSRYDMQETLLAVVWEAREWLSEAERCESNDERAEACSGALHLLRGALSMAPRVDADRRRIIDLLERAVDSTAAAAANNRLAASYDVSLAETDGGANSPSGGWDSQRMEKAGMIARRAAETARSETHRALAELCEVWPDAMLRIDV